MLSYHEYEKVVFDWLMSKHKENPEFTFSVRKKASRGSETDIFIGTKNSKYFATSFWNIPCGYPGSSIDLIVLGFTKSEEGFSYWLQFMFTRDPDGMQNHAALELIKALKPQIKEMFPEKFSTNSPENKMEKFSVSDDRTFRNIEELFGQVDQLLSKVIPEVDLQIEITNASYPSFTAHRYTKEEFDELISKMAKRLKKYSSKENQVEIDIKQLSESSGKKKFNSSLNQILYGPPGTGKTYHTINHALAILKGDESFLNDENFPRDKLHDLINEYKQRNQIRFVTFHPSFTYEDFVEGIKPTLQESDDEQTNISYEIQPGIFKQICDSASAASDLAEKKRYVLVIDEINRGNIPSIFGELITLIESDKRAGGKEETSVILPYSKDETPFKVPSNLYIIGTMNTADRSVEALDIALRRRFEFKSYYPDSSKVRQPDNFEVDLKALLTTINDRIEYLLDRDHTIGHSFFMDLYKSTTPEKDLQLIFKNKIIPLLEEYFYGQLQNIGLVLGSDFINSKFKEAHSTTLFPKNFSPQETPSERVVYRIVDPTTFTTLQPFINIYEES